VSISLILISTFFFYSNHFDSNDYFKFNNCQYNISYFENRILDNDNINNLNVSTKSISVFPEIENLLCLGRVLEVVDLDDGNLNLFIGSSLKFSYFFGNLSYLIFFLITPFVLSKQKTVVGLVIIPAVIFSISDILYLQESLLTIVLKSLLIFLATYANNHNTKILSKKIPAIERISYRNDINVLRAVAVISVVFYHAEKNFLSGGWLGVDIFFVISGFLISNIILSELIENKFSFKKFVFRRFKRIFPAFYFMMFLTIPASYLLLNPKGTLEYLNNLKYSIPFLSNIYLSRLDVYTAELNTFSPLLHTWSLSIEEQFYILFPLFLFLIYKYKKFSLNFLLYCYLFFLGFNFLITNNIYKFYFFQYRIWEFFLGFLIMVISQTYKIKLPRYAEFLSLTLITYSIFIFSDSEINSIFPKVICLFGVSGLLINTKENYLLNNLSKIKLIKTIGLISFSIYLYHQPVYAFVRIFLRRSFTDLSIETHVFSIFIIFITSFYSYKYIEKPFNTNLTKFRLINLILIAFVVLIFANLGIKSDGYSSRFDDIPSKVIYYSIRTNLYPSDDSLDDWNSYDCEYFPIDGYALLYENSARTSGPCGYLKNNAESNFILIGDSHANTLSVSTIYWGEKIPGKYNFVPINGTTGRCILSSQTDVQSFRFDCTQTFFNNFLDNLNESDVVAVIGRFPGWLGEQGKSYLQCEEECDNEKIIRDRLSKISKKVDKLIIIYPVPTHPYSIAESYLNRQNSWGEIVYTDYLEWNKISKYSYLFLDSIKEENIFRIYTEDLFCNTTIDKGCIAATEKELYYTDDNHLTIEGNYLIVNKLIEILNR